MLRHLRTLGSKATMTRNHTFATGAAAGATPRIVSPGVR